MNADGVAATPPPADAPPASVALDGSGAHRAGYETVFTWEQLEHWRKKIDAAPLTALDTEILVIALVPDLDSRFERLYGYLNDDVSRRRASVGLALQRSVT